MANLAPDLLAILRCPVTGSSLRQEGAALVTTAPAGQAPLRYGIEEGILVLLPAPLLDAALSAGSDQHDGPSASDSIST